MVQVIEKYSPLTYDKEGNVLTEIKVFVVENEGMMIARFFPEIDTETEVRAKADAFSAAYVVPVIDEPEYITREVKVEDVKDDKVKK